MNKSIFTIALLALSTSACAATDTAKRGGFTGPSDMVITPVAEAIVADDDTFVTMKGYISKAIGNEKYLFKDKTGTAVIEIDDKDWRGVEVSENDLVIISGEVDTSFNEPVEIDVDSIQLAK
ncbi:YgiW/YdeI family stress tolerance OB fold protein [Thalassotalea crassostreae]|uniref:YgiW/YdeI family stress tolerance OB fold protein n=1 Tax=Thalassotalea crassostreae TaxID=1763536 RepID=UPI000838FC1A|nr:NirD/YgiW/YdeI family stress tolerance protein [Thalassotalea crassostreae]